ncbi:helicase POLQ-like [Platysternon megacephalum]|uniref:Helicase POLQ-like n=1 Tax=Platysternon megacephalum TaxID=55544 RepID=A0A4D9E5T0_9SAUR|nr:helicase POLQ-like [Platysternon megacephalum]
MWGWPVPAQKLVTQKMLIIYKLITPNQPKPKNPHRERHAQNYRRDQPAEEAPKSAELCTCPNRSHVHVRMPHPPAFINMFYITMRKDHFTPVNLVLSVSIFLNSEQR